MKAEGEQVEKDQWEREGTGGQRSKGNQKELYTHMKTL